MDYGAEIRKLADEYAELTGHNPFAGVSLGSYYFDDGYLHNGPEALGHMRERLAAAKLAAGKQEAE